MKDFEIKKREFGRRFEKEDGLPMRIMINHLRPAYRISREAHVSNMLDFPRDAIVDIFEQILKRMISMIHQQVTSFHELNNQRIDAIIFVGGLSGNHYVRDRLKETFAGSHTEIGYHISVVTPDQRPETLVSRGSVIRALFQPVTEKVLAQSYGFCFHAEYRPELHGREAPTVADFFKGTDIVEDRMFWLCTVGQSINAREPEVFRMRGVRNVLPSENSMLMEPLFAFYTENRHEAYAYAAGMSVAIEFRKWKSVAGKLSLRHRDDLQ